MHLLAYAMSGIASWFRPRAEYGQMHVCASNTIPISTRIVVMNTANGATTKCVVIGTGPFVRHRILDVSPSVARALGFSGLAYVRIYARR